MDKTTSLIIVNEAAFEQGYMVHDSGKYEIHDPEYIWAVLEDKDVCREVHGKW